MRELTSEEEQHYERVRTRHPELELPEISPNISLRVRYSVQGPATHAEVAIADNPVGDFSDADRRQGWSAFSSIDRAMGKEFRPEVGEAVAFNRALKTPIWA